jgi:metallophosphoesterase superfamily enzyme
MDKILAQYLSKYPNMPSMTMAKLAYKEHPAVFKSLEHTRSSIRYRRGNNGNSMRKILVDKQFSRPNGKAGFRFEVPKSVASPNKNFIMPDGRTLVLADIHVPYHDEDALEVALKYGDKYKPTAILLNGDCMDFFAVSRWDKNPEERSLSQELQSFRQFLAHLRERYRKARIIMKVGNHEERWEKYLWAKAPELCGCEFISLSKILDLDKWGVDLVASKQKIKFGKHLTVIHGHEIPNGSTPVNFARTLQTKMAVCTIGAHRHTTSEHTQKNADGKYITCWGLGCLCDMTPDYAILNSWNHGFATVELKGNDFDVRNMRIINGEAK